MAQENISVQLNDLLASRDFQAELLDREGRPTDAENADIFTFDYVSSAGKDYGTMVIILDSENEMQVFYGDNLGRSMEKNDKTEFFDFVQHLHKFANMRRWTYSPKNINQIKYTMQGLAAIKEGLFEGYYGTRKISYSGEPTQARLVIQHNRSLGETDARYRYVESLFIETADSERFRLQFKNLAGARAMLEHVRQGGRPYDVRGSHITEMVNEIATLSRFNRASAGRVLEGVTAELVTEAQQYYQGLRENLKKIASSKGYQKYFESWHPAEATLQEELVDSIKTMFVEQTLDSRIEAALPVLARLQQENKMKEADIFESWANRLTEGTWALPETPEQQQRLQDLMSRELIVGPDATNATEQLYDLVGDDELFDHLNDLAERDARANIWDDSDVQRRLAELGIQTPQSTEAEPADVAQDTAPEVKEQGMAQGYQLDEGAVETITALVKKIPGIGKYYQMAQQYKPQLIEILKTSKSGKEVKQKMEQLAAGQSATVAESGMLKQLGGLAVGGGSILSTMWMNAMGLIDGVLAHAAAGEVGGAVASGSILGLIPVTLMLFAAMLMFKGSKQSSDEKAQAFQAQRGQQGMAEGTSLGNPVYIEGCSWDDVVDWLEKNVGPTTVENPNWMQGWFGKNWQLYPASYSDENGRIALQVSANTKLTKDTLKSEIEKACKQQGMAEGKADYNFDIEDLKRLERIRDLATLKAQALELISKPSAKPMKPEKVEWFRNALERMNSPLKVIKLMYDLLLSGEGNAVVGTKSSMNPNSYRQRFGEQDVAEGDALLARIKSLALLR